MRRYLVALAALSLAALIPTISATPVGPSGHLDIANCSGGGVTVTATTIDWTLPVGPPNGCIQTGSSTNVTYSGGTLGPATQGSILDLTFGGPPIVVNFMTFTGAPALHFDLTGLGPGVTNTACSAVLDPNAPSCSVSLGSPFILAPTSTGTSVTLSAIGNAVDANGSSTWQGAFTTQIAGVTPNAIKTTILTGGSVTSTDSGDFTLTVIPEPTTMSLLLIAGVLGFIGKKRKATV